MEADDIKDSNISFSILLLIDSLRKSHYSKLQGNNFIREKHVTSYRELFFILRISH